MRMGLACLMSLDWVDLTCDGDVDCSSGEPERVEGVGRLLLIFQDSLSCEKVINPSVFWFI